jgi:hypothetical protein
LTVLSEQGLLREPDSLGYRAQRDASTPAMVANEVPRPSRGYIIQDLPDHDARPFERGLAVANFGVGHDIFAQLDAFICPFAILHNRKNTILEQSVNRW